MVEVGLIGSQFAAGMWTQPVLAQVNFGGNPAALLGIALAVGGAGLYFLRSVRPQVARDYDIALAAVALLAGAILFFQGWRLDPILTFGCYLLAGAAGFFAFETIKLRGATAEQAKRYSPLVDDERPVSRVYQAELDEEMVSDRPNPATRRIRGTRDYRSSDYEDYGDDRRPAIRAASDRPPTERSSAPSRRRPASSNSRRSSSRPASRPSRNDWDEPQAPSSRYDSSFWEGDDTGDDRASTYSSSSGGSRSSSRPRRPRPPVDDSSYRSGSSSADYVDYQAVDYGDSDYDNSSNFDE